MKFLHPRPKLGTKIHTFGQHKDRLNQDLKYCREKVGSIFGDLIFGNKMTNTISNILKNIFIPKLQWKFEEITPNRLQVKLSNVKANRLALNMKKILTKKLGAIMKNVIEILQGKRKKENPIHQSHNAKTRSNPKLKSPLTNNINICSKAKKSPNEGGFQTSRSSINPQIWNSDERSKRSLNRTIHVESRRSLERKPTNNSSSTRRMRHKQRFDKKGNPHSRSLLQPTPRRTKNQIPLKREGRIRNPNQNKSSRKS